MVSASLVDARGILVVNRSVKLRFLSPSHCVSFNDGAITFKCLEQYMQHRKAREFADSETAKKILEAKTIKEYQRLGSQIVGFSHETWKTMKYECLVDGMILKFSQNMEFAKMLARTSGYLLAWCGFMDKFWSCGERESSPMAYHPLTWSGQNRYGRALMDTRILLRKMMGEEYEEWYCEGVLLAKYYPQTHVLGRLED